MPSQVSFMINLLTLSMSVLKDGGAIPRHCIAVLLKPGKSYLECISQAEERHVERLKAYTQRGRKIGKFILQEKLHRGFIDLYHCVPTHESNIFLMAKIGTNYNKLTLLELIDIVNCKEGETWQKTEV